MNESEYKKNLEKVHRLFQERKTGDALDLCVKLLQINPENIEVLSLYGDINHSLDNFDEAEGAYFEAYRLSNNEEYKLKIARMMILSGNIRDAVNIVASSNIKQETKDRLLADAFFEAGNHKNASVLYEKLYNDNNYIRSDLTNLAYCYSKLNEHKKAIEVLLDKYTEKYGISSEIYITVALNYADMNEFEKSVYYNDEALKLTPGNIYALQGKASSLDYLGKYEEATEIYERIKNSGKADYHTLSALSIVYLRQKRFEEGYELFLNKRKITSFSAHFTDKVWKKGIDVSGKDVLVYSDCGIGDVIMFARFLPELQKICKSVTVVTHKTLHKIFCNNFPGIKFTGNNDALPAYDIVLSIMDLQYLLDIPFDKIISSPAYLTPDKSLANKFNEEIFKNIDKPKIGVFRQGDKTGLKNRSIEKELINNFVSDNRFCFFNFQPDENSEETENFISLKKFITDYSDTAALLSGIDVLVTIDTSIAHMAGALGIKTFLMLPFSADWRWFNDRDKTVWYDSVKIFKQPRIGDWESVLNSVKDDLIKYEN